MYEKFVEILYKMPDFPGKRLAMVHHADSGSIDSGIRPDIGGYARRKDHQQETLSALADI